MQIYCRNAALYHQSHIWTLNPLYQLRSGCTNQKAVSCAWFHLENCTGGGGGGGTGGIWILRGRGHDGYRCDKISYLGAVVCLNVCMCVQGFIHDLSIGRGDSKVR